MRRICLLVVVALIAASCGDDAADPAPNPLPPVDDATVSPSSSPTTTTTTTTTTLRPPVPTDPPPLPEAMIGDLVIPCSAGSSSAIPDRPGVTDDAIVIGTGSDRGGIATIEAGRGIVEMIEVLADHCNANGGLLGRDVRVVEYDAAAVETASRVAQACDETVALVGHRFLEEVQDVLTALDCGLERHPAGTGLLVAEPIPLHAEVTAAFADPAAAQIVLVGPDTPTAAAERSRYQAALEAQEGPLDVVGTVSYPIDRRPVWNDVVGTARFSGAGQVQLVGGCAHAVVPFADAAAQAGWNPIIVATASAYDPACLTVADPSRLLLEVPFLPFEDGDAAPALAEHAALLDRVGAPRTGDGILAASAFWQWATIASGCLPDADRTCVTTERVALADWTAGGLHAAVAADRTSDGCVVVLGIEDGSFVRRLPVDAGTYDCRPELSVSQPG